MKNELGHFYDIVPVISPDILVKYMCITFALNDDECVARVPMDVCERICNLIKSNRTEITQLYDILDSGTYYDNPAIFEGFLKSAFNTYIGSRDCKVDFLHKTLTMKYTSIEIQKALNELDREGCKDILTQIATLVDLVRSDLTLKDESNKKK